jgi:hypothetical protein
MKKLIVLIYMIAIIILQACSGGSSGDTSVDQLQPDDQETVYSLNISITGNGTANVPGVTTHLRNSTVSISLTPDPGWIFDHWEGDLTGTENPVSIKMDGNINITAVFSINETGPVTPVDPIDNITVEQAEHILYATYAGIGYRNLDNTDDDETLYRINFSEINELAGKYVSTSLLYILLKGEKFDYTYQNSKAHFEIISGSVLDLFNPTSELNFKISVDISGEVSNNDIEYSGMNSNDLIIEATMLGSSSFDGTTVIIKNFTVTTGSHLKASYKLPVVAEVIYSQFKISYFLNENAVNCFLLPQGELNSEGQNGSDTDETPDLRYYSVNGALIINNKNYYWDIKYSQFDMKKINPISSDVYLSMKGKVAIPGMIGYAEISSPGFATMESYLTDETLIIGDIQDSIKRDTDGIFTAGTLTIKAENESTSCSFSSDGSVKIGSSQSISSWQDSLDPLK